MIKNIWVRMNITISDNVSSIGIAKIRSGMIRDVIVTFLNPSKDITEIIYPKNILPESPINIFAGWVLNIKNPIIAPVSTNENIPISSNPTTREIKLNAINATADKMDFEMFYVSGIVSKNKDTAVQTIQYYNPDNHKPVKYDSLTINFDERQPAYRTGVAAPYYEENK